jgi:hypothetical protein
LGLNSANDIVSDYPITMFVEAVGNLDLQRGAATMALM